MREKGEKFFMFIVLFLACNAFGVFLGGGSDNISQGAAAREGALNTVLWLFLYAILLFFLVFRVRRFMRMVASDFLLVFMLGYTAISVLWSPMVVSSAEYAADLLLTTMVGYYMAIRYTLREQATLVGFATAATLILSAIAAVVMPGTAFMSLYGGALRGITAHKNALSRDCVLGIVTFFYLGKNSYGIKKLAWYSLLPMALVLLLATKSAGGLMGFAGVTAAYVAIWILQRRTRGAIALGFFCLTFGFVIAVLIFMYLPVFFKVLGRDSSLTGRLPLWLMVLAAWSRQPLLGYGYAGFWRSNYAADMDATVNWDAPTAHNGFLNVLIELGLIGLTLFLIGFGRSYWRSIKLAMDRSVEFGVMPFMILSYLFITNVDEAQFFGRNTITWMIYVASICAVSRPSLHERVPQFDPLLAQEAVQR